MFINTNYNMPSFQARLKVQKAGFENLYKDLIHTAKSGANCTTTTPLLPVETTILPSHIMGGDDVVKRTLVKNYDNMSNNLDAISGQNIKTSAIESPEDIKRAASSAATVSTGSASVASGFAGYGASSGALLHCSIADGGITNFHELSGNTSVAHSADFLLDKTAALVKAEKVGDKFREGDVDGFAQAIVSTYCSTGGALLHGTGAAMIKDVNKITNDVMEKTSKNIPS